MVHHSLVKFPSGGFLVVWSEDAGSGDQIYFERYQEDGTNVLNPSVQATTDISDSANDNWYPSAAELLSGDFVVVWEESDQIYLQLYDSSQARIGTNTLISMNDISGTQHQP